MQKTGGSTRAAPRPRPRDIARTVQTVRPKERGGALRVDLRARTTTPTWRRPRDGSRRRSGTRMRASRLCARDGERTSPQLAWESERAGCAGCIERAGDWGLYSSARAARGARTRRRCAPGDGGAEDRRRGAPCVAARGEVRVEEDGVGVGEGTLEVVNAGAYDAGRLSGASASGVAARHGTQKARVVSAGGIDHRRQLRRRRGRQRGRGKSEGEQRRRRSFAISIVGATPGKIFEHMRGAYSVARALRPTRRLRPPSAW
ncbi:hypothetical protein B0H10DRAFT_358931 [Mycena sp. CBHHK59/15]|nr:hypothetical protein B0H10DRAFT_358931 [Mycena sp. CBHHK59/15]